MLHIKKLVGMHNKETYTRVYTRICGYSDIRVYAKYVHMIHVCVVHLYLTCTVVTVEVHQFIGSYFLTRCFVNPCTQVFAWGCGPCLGTGSVDATSARPRLIDELQSTCVIDIVAGDSHCLALSKGLCSGYFSVNSMTRLRHNRYIYLIKV